MYFLKRGIQKLLSTHINMTENKPEGGPFFNAKLHFFGSCVKQWAYSSDCQHALSLITSPIRQVGLHVWFDCISVDPQLTVCLRISSSFIANLQHDQDAEKFRFVVFFSLFFPPGYSQFNFKQGSRIQQYGQPILRLRLSSER